MAQIEVTLKSGAKVKGEKDDVMGILQSLGELPEEDGIHYISESKGPQKIREMHTFHIKNAICKMYRGWTAELNSLEIPAFLEALHNGPSSRTIKAMTRELITRMEERRL